MARDRLLVAPSLAISLHVAKNSPFPPSAHPQDCAARPLDDSAAVEDLITGGEAIGG
jgi:hypothetical protein